MHDLLARQAAPPAAFTPPPALVATATGPMGINALMVFFQLLLALFSIAVTLLLPSNRRSSQDWSAAYSNWPPWRRRYGGPPVSFRERLRKIKDRILSACHRRGTRVSNVDDLPSYESSQSLHVDDSYQSTSQHGVEGGNANTRSYGVASRETACLILEHLLVLYHVYSASIYLLAHTFFISPPVAYNPIIPISVASCLLYLPRRTIPITASIVIAIIVIVGILLPTAVLGYVKGFPGTGSSVYVWTNQTLKMQSSVHVRDFKPYTAYGYIYEGAGEDAVTLRSGSMSYCTTEVNARHTLQLTYYNGTQPTATSEPPAENGLTCAVTSTAADRCISWVSSMISFFAITGPPFYTIFSCGFGGIFGAVVSAGATIIGGFLIILPTAMAREGMGQTAGLSYVWCTGYGIETCSTMHLGDVQPYSWTMGSWAWLTEPRKDAREIALKVGGA